jgi:pre-mRNA-splicing factor ATP-dependent RNA helicase DHX38/PRP16
MYIYIYTYIYIHPKGLKKAREVHAQLLDIMKAQKIENLSAGGSWDVVRKAICSSYFYNSAKIKVWGG